eukprot:6180781-Pleurochrysis_carterae.AAC.3
MSTVSRGADSFSDVPMFRVRPSGHAPSRQAVTNTTQATMDHLNKTQPRCPSESRHVDELLSKNDASV